MSFYATMSGSVTLPDAVTFKKILWRLRTGGWVADDQFVSEDGEPVDNDKHIDHDTRTITIPHAYYRNLTRVMFFEHPLTTGLIRGASTDGVESCWIDGPPSVTIPEMPLELFAEPSDAPAGNVSEEDAAIERSEWLSDAIDIFHAESLVEIERVASEHFGRQDLSATNVDMLLLARQMDTLAQLATNAVDPVVIEHLDGLLNLIIELRS
jgi:hypothetical protein